MQESVRCGCLGLFSTSPYAASTAYPSGPHLNGYPELVTVQVGARGICRTDRHRQAPGLICRRVDARPTWNQRRRLEPDASLSPRGVDVSPPAESAPGKSLRHLRTASPEVGS